MFRKALLFGDEQAAERILASGSSRTAKALGRSVRGFHERVWAARRYDIVVAGNQAKFEQHVALRDFLVGTKDRILVEANPADQVWGIGLAEDDPRAENPLRWRGLNLLGFALMTVRSRLSERG